MHFRGVISQNIIRRKPYITLYNIRKNASVGMARRGRRFWAGPRPAAPAAAGAAHFPLRFAAAFRVCRKTWKKVVKKCWQEGRGVVLYLSAKRWGKRMTSARSLWKEPMSVKKGRLAPRNFKMIQVQKVQKLRKKDLTKNHFGGKINRSSAGRLRRYRTLKIEQYRKTCKEPLCVWKNT